MIEAADSPPSSNPRVWRETFLARYPRKWKLVGLGALLLLGALPFWGGEAGAPSAHGPEANADISAEAALDEPAKEAASQESAAPSPAAALGQETGGPPQALGAGPTQQTDGADPPENSVDSALSEPLAPAPDPSLVEATDRGTLPIIGTDGRQPWQVYARPFDLADKRPRIALVMDGMGLSRVATDAAIRQLPGSVSLAFDVHAPSLPGWLGRARQEGHETLLILPTEPSDYPRSDPGPRTLLTYFPLETNKDRLLWAMAQGAGYVGLMVENGQRFSSEPERLAKILQEIKSRGVLVFDASLSRRTDWHDLSKSLRVPFAGAGIRLDATPSPEGIDNALTYLEQTARVNGAAIGVASPLPLTIDRIANWSRQLAARGVVLAPVSAVVQ